VKLRFLLSLVGLAVILSGCSAPNVEPERPTPTATPLAASVLTPDTSTIRYRPDPIIGRLVLATQIGEDESPRDDITSVPANAQQLYLAVRVTDLPSDTRLVAVWIRGTNEIARSERRIDEATGGSRWFALALPKNVALSAGDYAVRLYLDDRFIDSVAFSVGGSRRAGSGGATLVFTDTPPSGSGAIRALETFPAGTSRVVAVLTDTPPDMQASLWSRWSVDGAVLTERGADDLVSPFLRTFTLQGSEPLPPGTYTVEIFADQQLYAQGTFQIAGATPTPAETLASVEDVRIVRAVEPGTGVPVGANVREVRAPTRIYVAILVRNLQASDALDVVWQRDGIEVSRQPVSGLTLPSNWIALPFDLPQESATEPVSYSVTVLLNGEAVAQRTLVVVP